MLARLILTICLFVGVAAPARAAAAPNADAILQKAFDNYRAKDSQSTLSMTIHRPAWERHMSVKAWTRGANDALVRFTAPAADAGNATLKLGNDTWVYNPKLSQVIKLPASMLTQSWMGSDFSYNDLAKSEDLMRDYTHRIVGSAQAGGHTVWSIEATPRPGAPVVWGKVVLKVRDDGVFAEETFYDQDMRAARRMTVDKIATLGGRPYPVVMTMHPLDQPNQWTQVQTSDARFDAASPSYLFTLSNLQNPRS